MFVELLYLLNSSVINLFELKRYYISWCHSNYCINHHKMSLQSILTWVMLHDQTNLDLLMTSQGALNYTDLSRCKISFRFIQFLMVFIWDIFYKAVPYGCSNVWTSFFFFRISCSKSFLLIFLHLSAFRMRKVRWVFISLDMKVILSDLEYIL